MKANELAIGDWVCTESDTTPRQVDWIRSGEVGLFWNKVVTPSCLVPIPLTAEILEKNGFTRYGQVYANLQQWVGKFGDKRKSLVQDIRTGEWGMNDVWIDYVHELQHVLKLCGIEKQIEL